MLPKIGIVVFAFGSPSSLEPNQRLRDIATEALLRNSKSADCRIFTQREIPPFHPTMDVRFISEQENAEPTLRIARWVVQEAIKKGISQLIVVAASPHIWRCLRDIRWAIEEKGENIHAGSYSPPEILASYIAPPNCYSVKSVQPRTRSAYAWWPREIILRMLPMWLYSRLAG